MNMFHNIMERLRPLVGFKGWDYCVLWKLSDDQRYVEWMDCCCSGTENTQVNGGEEVQFAVSSVVACRDIIFQHPASKSCELLAQLPSSIPLDSGIHAQALISNQARWLNFSNSSDSNVLECTVGTRALVPVPGGLLELFVTKQVAEDQNIIDFVTTQCSILLEQEAAMLNSTNNNIDTSNNFAVNVDHMIGDQEQSKQFLTDHHDQNEQNNHINNNQFQHTQVSPSATGGALENLNLPYDISAERIQLCSPPMNFLQQFTTNYSNNDQENLTNGLQDHMMMNNNTDNLQMKFMESSSANKDQQGNNNNDKDSIKLENGRSDSISDCSDQIDDENDAKYRRRTGRGPQAKNLHAERRRRKRLNGRLYDLRALVPKISNLNKASILGDAIEFVKELQKQAKELQDELEENSDDDQGGKIGNHNSIPQEILNQNGGVANGFHVVSSEVVSCTKLNQKSEISHQDKGQQMEVQVEVAQIDGNEFFVKVFCEHKAGGFMRLMEALDSLGLEVTNANVTSFRGLVSNVFKVEKKDSEMVQAEYVRESLLELTRDPSRGWTEMAKATENGNGMDYHPHHHHHHLHHHMHNNHLSSSHHHLHHLHN